MRIRPTAGTLIAKLGLVPRPEGGHARETWRAEAAVDGRPRGTAMLHLLASGEPPAWHRAAAPELWLFQGGDPLELAIAADDDSEPVRHVLGTEVLEGEEPQVVVPAGAWQSARTLGSWSLAGRVASSDARPMGVELAPAGWRPGPGHAEAAGPAPEAGRRRHA